MGIKLTYKGKSFDRWSEGIKLDSTDDLAATYTADNTVNIRLLSADTWVSWYNKFIQNRKQDCISRYVDLSTAWLKTINETPPIDGRFFIIGGNCLDVSNKLHIVVTGVNINRSYTKDPDVYRRAIAKLMRCQMCIYHFMNETLHKLLNAQKPYGVYLRYLGLQARWNAYIWGARLKINVTSAASGVYIDVGYVNLECEPVSMEADITILVNSDPMTVDSADNEDETTDIKTMSLGLHGVFLEETGGKRSDYTIMRSEILRGSDTVDRDITDPNTCSWGLVTWTKAEITQRIDELENLQYTRNVYSIRKNPNIVGFYKFSDDFYWEFTIDIKVKVNGNLIKSERHIGSCARLEQSTGNYIGAEIGSV